MRDLRESRVDVKECEVSLRLYGVSRGREGSGREGKTVDKKMSVRCRVSRRVRGNRSSRKA